MSLTLLKFEPKENERDPEWLTTERLTAYFVALSMDEELIHADELTRTNAVDRVVAGMRQASRLSDSLDTAARCQCLALMAQDEQSRQARIATGGW